MDLAWRLRLDSPIPRTWIQGEIGADELRCIFEIDTGDRDGNLRLLRDLEGKRDVLKSALGPLEFNPGTHRSKITRRHPWEGRLIDQLDRHDEALAWFGGAIRDFRTAFETVAQRTERQSVP